jgi:hypothetical protein
VTGELSSIGIALYMQEAEIVNKKNIRLRYLSILRVKFLATKLLNKKKTYGV